jgi:uncharacterized membrane-anchored protein YitT (DUF2179 family)
MRKKHEIFWAIVTLPFAYFALGFVFLYVGLQTYFNGYHGVDLMFNRCLLSLATNNSKIMEWKEVVDIKDGNVIGISPLELYNRGLSSLNDSVRFLILAGLFFGIGIGLLLKSI